MGRRITRRRALGAGVAGSAGVALAFVGYALGRGGSEEPDDPELPSSQGQTVAAPAATARTEPTRAIDHLQPDPSAWERHSFAPRAPIDLKHGIFFMDTATGEVDGWALAFDDGGDPTPSVRYSPGASNRLVTGVWNGQLRSQTPLSAVVDRATGQAWSWPTDLLVAAPVAGDLVLFADAGASRGETGSERPTPVYVADSSMRIVGEFELAGAAGSVSRLGDTHRQVLSLPDKDLLVFIARDPARLVEVHIRSGEVRDLAFAADLAEGAESILTIAEGRTPGRLDIMLSKPPVDKSDGPEVFLVQMDLDGTVQLRLEAGAQQSLAFHETSPDGRFELLSGTLRSAYQGVGDNEDWVYAETRDASTGKPAFRALSGHLQYGDLLPEHRWLADSSGFIVQTQDQSADPTDSDSWWSGREYRVVAVDGSDAPLALPSPEAFPVWWNRAPVPSPDDPSLLSLGRTALYNRASGQLIIPGDLRDPGEHLDPWGNDSSEMRFALPHGGHDGAGPGTILPLQVEFAPFSSTPAFTVARTGGCANLRAGPSLDSEILDCLPDGAGVVLSPPLRPDTGREEDEKPIELEPSAYQHDPTQAFVRVRTEAEIDGWIAIQFLDWA